MIRIGSYAKSLVSVVFSTGLGGRGALAAFFALGSVSIAGAQEPGRSIVMEPWTIQSILTAENRFGGCNAIQAEADGSMIGLGQDSENSFLFINRPDQNLTVGPELVVNIRFGSNRPYQAQAGAASNTLLMVPINRTVWESMLREFAAASTVQLTLPSGVVINMGLVRPAAALQAFRRCLQDGRAR